MFNVCLGLKKKDDLKIYLGKKGWVKSFFLGGLDQGES